MVKLCLDCGKKIWPSSARCVLCEMKNRRGANNPGWKGGRQDNGQGYIILIIDGKKIREHRYVMQMHIGRELLANETVHHINGNKSDNRIENLEIWNSGRQSIQRDNGLMIWLHMQKRFLTRIPIYVKIYTPSLSHE